MQKKLEIKSATSHHYTLHYPANFECSTVQQRLFILAIDGVSEGLMRKVQSAQNAAVRLITGTKPCDHITLVLRQLHWLPVRQRVTFKLACLVYQSLSGNASMYLAMESCIVATIQDSMTWQTTFTCCLKVTVASFVPQAPEHALFQEHTIATVTEVLLHGPRLWNSLPSHLWHSDIGYSDFKRQLKTFLYE